MGANNELRDARLSRPSPLLSDEPMSRGELADAVNAHLWHTTSRQYVLDAHTIARYERGAVRWPCAAYRSALRAVLGVTTNADLGFRPTRRGRSDAHRPTDPSDPSSTAAGQPVEVPLDRRDLLRSGLAGLAATALGRGDGPDSPADRQRELQQLQHRDRTHGSEQTLVGVLSTLDAVEVAVQSSRGADRIAMLRVASRTAEFAGFLYRDLGNRVRCLYWHDRAMEWAQQGDDVAMQSYVLLRKAQAAYDQRDAARMLDLTLAAARRETSLGPGLRAEIQQQRARGEAMLGATDRDVRHRLDQARAELAEQPDQQAEDEPGCHYNAQLLALQTAVCISEAGRPGEAVVLYQQILTGNHTSARDRAYFQILMATSLAMSGEPDEAARIGCAALPTAVAANSRRSIGEAGVLLAALRPWRQRSQVRQLDDALRTACAGSVP